ncbi:MAG: peptide chain release factor N(5)-glutamine methyltransferase [Armatimonadota bacterium]|nr:peptide chain release factor N(5)-glutamine methyltransferase [Armatimonadota bacterium]
MQVDATFQPTIKQILTRATAVLEKVEVETPLLDAEVMLSESLGVPRSYLFAHPEQHVEPAAASRFEFWLRLREQRVPLAYIIGHKEFHGLDIEVTPAVLVPRQETETLVEATVAVLKDIPSPLVAEVGVGSGAVAIALAKSIPSAKIFATDSSEEALQVARRNINRHGMEQRIELRLGNFLEPLAGLVFDVVVSNPPYIPTDEIPSLQPEVARYEPIMALDGGMDGLDCYRKIVREAPRYLKQGGRLLFEVGWEQAENVKAILASAGFVSIHALRDLSGVERVISGVFPCSH